MLTPELAGRVRLPLTSRFTGRSLAAHAERHPGMGLIADEGRQYAIAGPWRNRAEIAELLEVSPGNLRSLLVGRLGQLLRDRGVRLVVLDYGLGALDHRFFRAEGFDLIERIIELERPDRPIDLIRAPGLAIRRYQPADRETVLDLERESFPWLWWNSPEEWENYLRTREVEVIVGAVQGRIVGYAGSVVFGRDGHLDRLAVRESEQGKRYGAALLSVALERMRQRGATKISLTTQENNLRSQALYFRNGFQRGRWTYEIHGKWLDEPEPTVGSTDTKSS